MGHLEWSRIYNIQRNPRMKYEHKIKLSNLDIEPQHDFKIQRVFRDIKRSNSSNT